MISPLITHLPGNVIVLRWDDTTTGDALGNIGEGGGGCGINDFDGEGDIVAIGEALKEVLCCLELVCILGVCVVAYKAEVRWQGGGWVPVCPRLVVVSPRVHPANG